MAPSVKHPNHSGANYNNQILAKAHQATTPPPHAKLPPSPDKNHVNRWKQLKAGRSVRV